MPAGDYNRKSLHDRAWNGRTSAKYGCTVTFENESGQTLVLAREGSPSDVLRALCAEAIAADPSFRVVAYSSPETIRHDLRGRFSPELSARSAASQRLPEGRALARVGLTALIHPRLVGSGREAQNNQAQRVRDYEVGR